MNPRILLQDALGSLDLAALSTLSLEENLVSSLRQTVITAVSKLPIK